MYKLPVIGVLFLWWSAVVLSANPILGMRPFFASDEDEVQLRQLLADVGTKNGVMFTIEEALLKGGAMDHIRSSRHRRP